MPGGSRVVAVVALRSAVERGEPFAQEIAAAKPLVPDAGSLAPLESVRRDRPAAHSFASHA